MRNRYRRSGLVGVVLAVVVLSLSSAPVSASGSTAFNATFNETTTFKACPPGVPAGSQCFEGAGNGLTNPPGDPNSVEHFAGFVDPTGHDANIVSIATNKGTLFLTTSGQVGNGGATESGTWTAHGGTGIFEDATGTGTVNTQVTSPPLNGSVTSLTIYKGSLNLDSGD